MIEEPERAFIAGTAFDRLTRQERRCFQLAARGKSNKQIAAMLHVHHGTVKAHMSAAYQKLAAAGLPCGDHAPRPYYAYLMGLADGVYYTGHATGHAVRAEQV